MKSKIASILATFAVCLATSNAAILFGVDSDNNLVSFDSAVPGSFITSNPITGLFAPDGVTVDPFAFVVNLSYNPLTGGFVGIDSNANIYSIGLSGNTSLLNNTFSPIGFDSGLSYDTFTGGFLYADDVADRFNISNAGMATLVGSAFYGPGDANEASTPQLIGNAIDFDFGDTLFLDANLGILAAAIDPDALELFTIGSLGFAFTGYSDLVFDFEGNLFASISTDSLTSSLYSIDSSNGSATLIGSFGQGVGTITIPEPSSILLGAVGMFALLRRRRA